MTIQQKSLKFLDSKKLTCKIISLLHIKECSQFATFNIHYMIFEEYNNTLSNLTYIKDVSKIKLMPFCSVTLKQVSQLGMLSSKMFRGTQDCIGAISTKYSSQLISASSYKNILKPQMNTIYTKYFKLILCKL